MANILKLLLAAALTFAALFVGATYVALEWDGVAIVETKVPFVQQTRSTHIWYVEDDSGALLLEAGDPQNPWVRDLGQATTLELTVAGVSQTYQFAMHTDTASHKLIRSLMRKKYGWRDRWIALLFDTSRSHLITLTDP